MGPTLPATAGAPSQGRRTEVLGWLALAALLVLLLPVFVCMPLTVDTAFYDICARYILRGGALERDLLCLMPPGMAWSLAAVRATLGGSSVAARVADLGVVAGIIGLLAGWLRAAGLSRAACTWVAVLLAAFYLTTTEWEQVQPDIWMFLPALGALALRRRQVAVLTGDGQSVSRTMGWAALEGALWAAACLFKPFVIVPAAGVWLASVAVVRRSGAGRLRRMVPDAAGLLIGGLLIGAVWQGWLLSHGAWRVYWHNFAEFQGDFYTPLSASDRLLGLFLKLPPWGALHIVGVPVAIVALARAVVGRGPLSRPLDAQALLAAGYLGWLYQANFLQSQFHYHLVPPVFLATALLAGWLGRTRRAWQLVGTAALAVFWVVAVAVQPAVRPARLALWADCWRQGPTPDMKDRLHLWHTTPTWVDLDRVADYLRRQGAGDRDVLCFDLSTTELQPELGVSPPTRHIYPATNINTFKRHQDAIREELRQGPQRWAVIDLEAIDVKYRPGVEEPPAPLDLPPQLTGHWLYALPPVFRSGRYCVLRVR